MKHLVSYILLGIVATVTAGGQGFRQYEFQLYRELPELSYCTGYEYTRCIDDFAVDERSRLITWDMPSDEVLRIDLATGAREAFYLDATEVVRRGYRLQWDGTRATFRNYAAPIIVYDTALTASVEVDLLQHGLNYDSLRFKHLAVGDLVIVEDTKEGAIHTFQIIETESGLDYIYRDPDQTRAYVEERYEGRDEFWFDGEFLMYGERLVTGNPKTFAAYRERKGLPAESMIESSDTGLIGVDEELNSYWQRGGRIIVFDVDGFVRHRVRVEYDPNRGRLQIDPAGNIYALSYGGITPGQLDLLWIERDW